MDNVNTVFSITDSETNYAERATIENEKRCLESKFSLIKRAKMRNEDKLKQKFRIVVESNKMNTITHIEPLSKRFKSCDKNTVDYKKTITLTLPKDSVLSPMNKNSDIKLKSSSNTGPIKLKSKFVSSFKKLILEKTQTTRFYMSESRERSPNDKYRLNSDRTPRLPKITTDSINSSNIHQQLENVTKIFCKKLGIKNSGSKARFRATGGFHSSITGLPKVCPNDSQVFSICDGNMYEEKIGNLIKSKFYRDAGEEYLKEMMDMPLNRFDSEPQFFTRTGSVSKFGKI